MARTRAIGRTAVVLATVGLSAVVAAQPAAAHGGFYSKDRSGCHYSGGVSIPDNFAWTQKDSGGCAGHAWLKIEMLGGRTEERHASGRVEFHGTVVHAWHKSQANEGWVQSH